MQELAKPSDTCDAIVLRAPREAGSLPVVRLVIAGVASRHALSVERLDDVLLAVETLLRNEPPEGPELVVTLRVSGDVLRVTLGGLGDQTIRRALGEGQQGDLQSERRLDVRLLMDSLVDSYHTADEDACGSFAVEMEKRIF